MSLLYTHSLPQVPGGGAAGPEAFAVAAHPALPLMATAWVDGRVRLLAGVRRGSVQTPEGMVHDDWEWEWLQELPAHTAACFGVAFGRGPVQHLASVGKDFSLAVFRPRRDALSRGFAPAARLAGHMAPCLALAFHPAGLMIATAAADHFAAVSHFPRGLRAPPPSLPFPTRVPLPYPSSPEGLRAPRPTPERRRPPPPPRRPARGGAPRARRPPPPATLGAIPLPPATFGAIQPPPPRPPARRAAE